MFIDLNKNSKKMLVLYALSIILFAPLSVYSSGILSFTIGDFVLFISFVMFLCASVHYELQIHFMSPILVMMLCICANIVMWGNDLSNILRAARLLFYLLYVYLFAEHFFNFDIALSCYKKVAFFATIFLFLQFFLYYVVGYYLPGYLPFLNVMRDELVEYSADIYISVNQRMRSIFQEPAHYAAYVSFCVFLIFLKSSRQKVFFKKDLVTCTILSIGVFLSQSTTGVVLILFSWLIFFSCKLTQKNRIEYLITFFLILVFVVWFLPKLEIVQSSFYRLTSGASTEIRLSSNFDILSFMGGGVMHFYLGYGMNLFDLYLASYGRLWYYFGLCGLCLFVIPLFVCSVKNIYCLLLFMFLFFLGIGTSVWVSGNIMIYLSFWVVFFFAKDMSLYEKYPS